MIGNIVMSALGERLKKDPKPSSRLYADSLMRAGEVNKVNMGAEFDVLMKMGDSAVEAFAESCMVPLTETAIDAKKNFDLVARDSSASHQAKVIATLRNNQAMADKTFMEAYLKQTGYILAAEAAQGQLQVQEQVLMPLQYINYLQSTARHIVPAEVVDNEIFIRQRHIKVAKIRGSETEYKFPEALQNKTYLDAVLSADNKSEICRVNTTDHPSNQVLDLVSLFGVGYSNTKDKINGVVKFKKIKLVGVAEPIVLADTYNNMIDLQKKGDTVIFTTVKDSLGTSHKIQIAATVDFVKSTMEYTATANVEEFYIEMSIKGGNFGRGIETREYKENFHYHVTKHIQGSFNWNYREVLQKMNFEHTDLIVTAAEMMGEVFDAAKDHYQYSELDKSWDELVALNTAGMLPSTDFVAALTVDLGPDPTKVAVVTDNPGSLRNTFINDAVTKLLLQVRNKYKPKTGMTTNMWTNLEIARVFGPEETVVAAGENYGGVSSIVNVRGGSIKGNVYKLVETQRENLASTEIKMIPFFNDANNETYKFLQWETRRFDDNSYRDPIAPNQPSFHVVDYFQFIGVNKAMYRLNITNKDALMGSSSFTVNTIEP